MNNVYFPVHVVTLLRRLVNVMATFSLSGQYLMSRVRTEDTSCNTPEDPKIPTDSKDFWWNLLSMNKWDWLRVGLLANSVLEQPTERLSTHPHWTSEGTFLSLAFTSVYQTHAVIRKQADASLWTIPEH